MSPPSVPGPLTCLLALALALLAPASALAAPPVISGTGFSEVTESAATLEASVDPTKGATEASFQYTSLEAFKAEEFQNAQSAPAGGIAIPAEVQGSGDLETGASTITATSASAGRFGPGQMIKGEGIPAETTITAVEAKGEAFVLTISKAATATASGVALNATGPQPIGATLEGLSPATGYVFRVVAKKTGGKKEEALPGPATTFYTFAATPSFEPCPNDDFRSGQFSVPGHPGALLPDCRSYELASPLAKNGNDVLSTPGFTRVAEDGGAITFGSTFGIPGGAGAQQTPFFQAARGEGEAGWQTSGVMPPAGSGAEAHALVGQLPDLSATYATASKLGDSTLTTLLELHRDGSPPAQLTPYVEADAKSLGFAGASADAETLLIESLTALPAEEGGQAIPGSAPGSPNVYAWDRATGQLHLASTMNTEEKTQELLAKGAFAGPYNWENQTLGTAGGALGGYYLTDEHAVAQDGSVFFTSRSSGHLYQRLHPTAPQSAVIHGGEPNEECTEPQKACTLDLSASHRSPLDPGGEQPAAFQAATADGSQVLFTSHEELTEDANTGPEQPQAAIGRARLNGEEPADEIDEEFLHAHALGLAIDPKGEYLYWADPSKGTIGRAGLDGSGDLVSGSVEPEYIVPPASEGKCEEEVDPLFEPGVFTPIEVPIPSEPRYVAVDSEHVYWTNTGRRGANGLPIDGGGTIGRAKLNGAAVENVEPAFICGEDAAQPNERLASNPQGIAVNAERLYWANAAQDPVRRTIVEAAVGGSGKAKKLLQTKASRTPDGVALSPTYLYFAENDELNNKSYIERVPLAGGEGETSFIAEAFLRGVALDSQSLYWTTQGEANDIARSDLALEKVGPGFDVEGTPTGVAVVGNHLYWSTNGEVPPNPGSDLYRYTAGAAEPLSDLTPDQSDENGAEVKGVLGTSADGSYVYFAANADLDQTGLAKPGDCRAVRHIFLGQCSVYLYHEGQISFVARLTIDGAGGSDANDWLAKANADPCGAVCSLQRSSLVSPDGKTLIFRSQRDQTSFASHGTPQFYRFRLGEGVTCLTCNPSGDSPLTGPVVKTHRDGPTFGELTFTFINPGAALGSYRVGFASKSGNRLFFESPEALVSYDTDGTDGCELSGPNGKVPTCLDVYEWEAPGTGSCTVGGPGYSPLNEGCLYLLSQDAEGEPAFFANASPSGDDAFIYTRSQLIGEDTDGLRDAYDLRAGGGLASQNTTPGPPCEGEGCKPAATPTEHFEAPPRFSGPPDPKPKRCKGKKCHRHHKHKTNHKKHRNHRAGGSR